MREAASMQGLQSRQQLHGKCEALQGGQPASACQVVRQRLRRELHPARTLSCVLRLIRHVRKARAAGRSTGWRIAWMV